VTAHLSSEARAEMRARAEAATSGEWYTLDRRMAGRVWICTDLAVGMRQQVASAPDDADAAHIAGMDPAATLALLADLDAAEGAIARVRYDAERVLAVEMGNYPTTALAAFATRILAALDADAAAGGEQA
jgi:hypothetical protein